MEDKDLENLKELMDAPQAVQYLAQKWGIESYSVAAFKTLRHRWKLQPALASPKATFWRKSDLDKIPKPSRSNPRPLRRRLKKTDGGGGENSSVMLMECELLALELGSVA